MTQARRRVFVEASAGVSGPFCPCGIRDGNGSGRRFGFAWHGSFPPVGRWLQERLVGRRCARARESPHHFWQCPCVHGAPAPQCQDSTLAPVVRSRDHLEPPPVCPASSSASPPRETHANPKITPAVDPPHCQMQSERPNSTPQGTTPITIYGWPEHNGFHFSAYKPDRRYSRPRTIMRFAAANIRASSTPSFHRRGHHARYFADGTFQSLPPLHQRAKNEAARVAGARGAHYVPRKTAHPCRGSNTRTCAFLYFKCTNQAGWEVLLRPRPKRSSPPDPRSSPQGNHRAVAYVQPFPPCRLPAPELARPRSKHVGQPVLRSHCNRTRAQPKRPPQPLAHA